MPYPILKQDFDDQEKPHYVYAHKHGADIFYVGKGKNTRAFTKSGRNNKWSSFVRKINHQYDVVELGRFKTNDEAIDYELKMIDLYKPSCNFRDNSANPKNSPGVRVNQIVKMAHKLGRPVILKYSPAFGCWTIRLAGKDSKSVVLSEQTRQQVGRIVLFLEDSIEGVDK